MTYNIIEDRRQALFGYRRDEKGEIIEASPMWDPGSVEAKQVMEETRLRLFGYARNFQGAIVGTVEEACERPGVEIPQPSPAPQSRQRLQSIVVDLSILAGQADRLTRSIRGLRD